MVVYEVMGSCGCVRGDGIVWLCTRRWDRVVVYEVMELRGCVRGDGIVWL